MMYEAIIDTLMGFEGGVEDVGDGAGLTRWGQTDAWLEYWRLPTPSTPEEARANYETWLVRSGLGALVAPPGVSDMLSEQVIDFALNAGEARAVRALQRAWNSLKWGTPLLEDGVIGPKTTDAIRRVASDKRAYLAGHVFADRLRHYGRITRLNPTRNAAYIEGWMNRAAALADKWWR